ncbi:MICOS complex subunit Mic10-like [Peromyscus eremicus]|uniref:MICOS complex subunit Mic10-like n=1 Tax=Peromyscus eremicus TaxID=42410 RepID=UPI0027DDEAAA|nr:MICOS complex subunit Mic10-like [Peromyscus eremicus]
MSESDLARKWDRCMAEVEVKLEECGPLAFGSGVGLGMAYSICQQDLQAPYLLHGKYVKRAVTFAENLPVGGKRNHVYSSGMLTCPGVC